MDHEHNKQTALVKWSNNLEADIIYYVGSIDHAGADYITNLVPENNNVVLILCTAGGDPHAAYKIARALQAKYQKFYLYVNGYCKSAGTLIAIGSDEIIMGNGAELGPLDAQLEDKDEFLSRSSALNVQETLDSLRAEALKVFRKVFLELTQQARISTKVAAGVAVELAGSFIAPIASQITPMILGETKRAARLAVIYGQRLISDTRGNIKFEQLCRLVESYPDHGFVIDFEESKNIFKKVRKCNDLEVEALSLASSDFTVQFKQIGDNSHVDRIHPKKTIQQENTAIDIRGNNESVGKSNKGARGGDLPDDRQKTVMDGVVNEANI